MEALVLFVIALSLGVHLWYRLYGEASSSLQKQLEEVKHPEVTEIRDFSLAELAEFDGLKSEKVYMAVKEQVFDVTSGKNFYGPNGPYCIFAGRDASVGLAKQSFSPEDVSSTSPLSHSEKLNLDSWHERLSLKYPCVGRLTDRTLR